MQSLERMQALLELGSFELQLIFLEEAAIDGKIVLVPEQQGGGFLAVASRATGLLRIVVQADKRRMVDNEPNIGNIDTQTKGVRGHHHLYLSAGETLQTGRLVFALAVVKLGLKTLLAQVSAQLFHAVDSVSVDDDTLALMLSELFADDLALAQLNEVRGLAAAQTVPDLDHTQLDVVAGHTAANDMCALDAQLFENVLLGGRRGRCRECANDRRRREALHKVANAQVVLAKAGALLADAMHLVDHDACKVGLAECRLHLAVLQHLGCDEQEQ